MTNMEGRLARLEEQLGDKHGVALDWLLSLLRTIQGDCPEASERLQRYADAPVTRVNTQRMHDYARRVLAGDLESEPDAIEHPAMGCEDTAIGYEPEAVCELDLSE